MVFFFETKVCFNTMIFFFFFCKIVSKVMLACVLCFVVFAWKLSIQFKSVNYVSVFLMRQEMCSTKINCEKSNILLLLMPTLFSTIGITTSQTQLVRSPACLGAMSQSKSISFTMSFT